MKFPPRSRRWNMSNTIMKLETDGSMNGPKIPEQLQLALDMAKAGGMKDLGPAAEIISTAVQARSDQVLRPARWRGRWQ